MNAHLKRTLTRIAALVLMTAILSTAPVFAATTRFHDVPAGHWAYTEINALTEGGLISGYGGGVYGPADTFTIAQMCQIVCRAKGWETGEKNGYWAYKAVENCLNGHDGIAKCLPDNLGAITAENYQKPITRELATYMLVKAFGQPNVREKAFEYYEIPDWGEITHDYLDAITAAYSWGITKGIDDKGTFNPKGLLNRAQAAVMLYRAGHTTAAEIVTPDENATAPNLETLYNQIYDLGIWRQKTKPAFKKGDIVLSSVSEYGNIELDIWSRNGTDVNAIEIRMDSMSSRTWGLYLSEFNYVVPPLTGVCDLPSGWSYKSRQMVKQILEMAYPTESAEAYEGMKGVFLQKTFDSNGCDHASSLKWLDDRFFEASLFGDYSGASVSITIGEVNNTNLWEIWNSSTGSSAQLIYNYPEVDCRQDVAEWVYQLNRW